MNFVAAVLANAALQRHHKDLESRVQQRTRELQHSNAVLASEVQQRLHAESVLRASECKLQALARMDALTELPNRRHFNEKLDEAIRRSGRTGQMFLDVDHFKRINDRWAMVAATRCCSLCRPAWASPAWTPGAKRRASA